MRNFVLSTLRGRFVSIAVLAVIVGLATPVLAQEGGIKIAVVDLELVVARSAAGQALQGQLAGFQSKVQGDIERMNSEVEQIRERVAQGANSLSEDKLSELRKQFEDKQIEIRRYKDDKQREGQKMQAEGLRVIEAQLEPVFSKVRDEGGYDLILNRVPGVVIMASEKVDITEKVLATFNSSGQ